MPYKSALVAAAGAGLASAQFQMQMTLPAWGTVGPITGQITAPSGSVYSNYKVAVLTSADGGNTWWDKSHGPYFLKYQADPSYDAGDAQNAAVVVQPNWSWELQGYSASPVNDDVSALWRAYLMPSSYDMKWPDYQVEGIAMIGSLPQNALTCVQGNKQTGVYAACEADGSNTAAASPAAASPSAAAASPSSAAASPSSAAASPSSAAASPSSAAASPSSAAAASPAAASPEAASSATSAPAASSSAPAASTAVSPSASAGAAANDASSPNLRASSGAETSFTLAAAAAAVAVGAVVMAW